MIFTVIYTDDITIRDTLVSKTNVTQKWVVAQKRSRPTTSKQYFMPTSSSDDWIQIKIICGGFAQH